MVYIKELVPQQCRYDAHLFLFPPLFSLSEQFKPKPCSSKILHGNIGQRYVCPLPWGWCAVVFVLRIPTSHTETVSGYCIDSTLGHYEGLQGFQSDIWLHWVEYLQECSTHLVKRSVITKMYLLPLTEDGRGPMMSHVIFWNGMLNGDVRPRSCVCSTNKCWYLCNKSWSSCFSAGVNESHSTGGCVLLAFECGVGSLCTFSWWPFSKTKYAPKG